MSSTIEHKASTNFMYSETRRLYKLNVMRGLGTFYYTIHYWPDGEIEHSDPYETEDKAKRAGRQALTRFAGEE